MSRIPLHVKVSLINNYIQSNYLKSRGKAEHDDWPISKILESIIEDLNTYEKGKENAPEQLPIGLIVRDLKSLKDKQRNLNNSIDSIIEELNSLKDEQADPAVDLQEMIKKLESFGTS